MPFMYSRQDVGRGDSQDPQNTASSSQQSGRLGPGAPANNPAGGPPTNGSSAPALRDPTEVHVDGFVVPGEFNNSDPGPAYVRIRLISNPPRDDVVLDGDRATAARYGIGGSWSNNLPLTVIFRGSNVSYVRYRTT